tara:strand:- start:24928 stop:25842 length:915 start_codon:yes stop_codon:yes gene_type:complete
VKVYLNKINESWIIDRVRHEWINHNKNLYTTSTTKSDIIWILSPWLWKKISKSKLSKKKVLCSHYHFDFANFNREDFYELDQYVNEYHVISKKTEDQLRKLTDKKITSIPFWINQKIFFEIQDKQKLRQDMGFSKDDYLIGSFQRDTEGNDLVSPKLIKGPDIFFDIITNLYRKNKNLKVVLTGKRREYLKNKFDANGIPYIYYEMADFGYLNKLYNLLDLYIVSSRIEGGPQAILECGITKTPIVSTDVGVASEILHKESIYNPESFQTAKPNVDYAYNKCLEFSLPHGIDKFNSMLKGLYES